MPIPQRLAIQPVNGTLCTVYTPGCDVYIIQYLQESRYLDIGLKGLEEITTVHCVEVGSHETQKQYQC